MALARALAALITAYIPLRLAFTAFFYCRERETPRPYCRWHHIADWLTRYPNLFPSGRRFLTSPGALCLVAVTATGATRLFM